MYIDHGGPLRAKHTTFNLDLFNLQAVILLEDREKGKGHRHIMLGRDMPESGKHVLRGHPGPNVQVATLVPLSSRILQPAQP